MTKIRVEMPAGSPLATTVAFPPHGQSFVSGDQDGGMRSWDWPSGVLRSKIKPHGGKIDALAVSRDGRFLLQIDHGRKARLWDLSDGRGLRSIAGEWESASFVPDGSAIAMTRHDGAVVLVDAATLAETPALFAATNDRDGQPVPLSFGPIAVSPDGRSIASGSRLGPIVCVWDRSGGPPAKTLREHADRISAVGFADDSKHILTASHDGVAKIWAPIATGRVGRSTSAPARNRSPTPPSFPRSSPRAC